MKMMNGKVLEWELEETGFAEFDAQCIRMAIDRWERRRNGETIKTRFNFKFGKAAHYDKRKRTGA